MLGLPEAGSYSAVQVPETLWTNVEQHQMSLQQTVLPSPGVPQRPLLPRRNTTMSRVQGVREKPYTRRKSSTTNTFTNAHELALWESKMRNPGGQSQSPGGGYAQPGGVPPVQMTVIPMVQDYLIPSKIYSSSIAESNSTPPPLSPSQSPHPAHQSSALNAGLGSVPTIHPVSSTGLEGGFSAPISGPGPSVHHNSAQQPRSVTPQKQHASFPDGAAPPLMPSPLSRHQSFTNAHAPAPPPPASFHTWPNQAPSGPAPEPVPPLDHHWGTVQPQYPQDVASAYTAPIFMVNPVGVPAPTQPAATQSPFDSQPFTPYGPYPSGQCTWYYYDPDNSPMPPPPVPSVAQPAPIIPASEHPDPFPGALADARGWYLLDLKTNLPFHVPCDPNTPTPEPIAKVAAMRALRLKAGKLPKAQSSSPQAPPRNAQTLHSRSNSVPTVPFQDFSPPALGATSPLTPLTPGSSVSAFAASDADSPMNFPTISPAFYYSNPAHMSSLFKRRQKGVCDD